MPYGDSPLDNENVGKQVYMDILYQAKRYVHMMTPYLILDQDMISALTYAAKRGVETVIIMPHIPDKIYAYLLARSYYEELLMAGVQIYEYDPGFVHAKVYVSDDVKAVVGDHLYGTTGACTSTSSAPPIFTGTRRCRVWRKIFRIPWPNARRSPWRSAGAIRASRSWRGACCACWRR